MNSDDKAIAIIDSYIAEAGIISSTFRDSNSSSYAVFLGVFAILFSIYFLPNGSNNFVATSVGAVMVVIAIGVIIYNYIQNSFMEIDFTSYLSDLSDLKRAILRDKFPNNIEQVDLQCEVYRKKFQNKFNGVRTLRGVIERYLTVRFAKSD